MLVPSVGVHGVDVADVSYDRHAVKLRQTEERLLLSRAAARAAARRLQDATVPLIEVEHEMILRSLR
jgi:hypothetical protein